MLDVSAAYPSNQIVFNVSKETTKKEICKIVGVNEYVYRLENINISGGHTNAVSYCNTMFNFPTLPKLLEHFNNKN